MQAATHHVAVLGASPRPDRYSNQAIRLLQAHGYRITPLHPKFEAIEGLPVCHRLDAVGTAVDTLTLYVGTRRLEPMVGEIVALHPGRVIFNPGTESRALQQALDAAGIPWLEGCTLVMLNLGRF